MVGMTMLFGTRKKFPLLVVHLVGGDLAGGLEDGRSLPRRCIKF